jgi:tetratricopeptide (TPR) repeat protein
VSAELPESIYAKIVELSEEGNSLAQRGDAKDAFQKFWAAFDLLPEPKQQWEAATWLLASIGDMLFLAGKFAEALDAFNDAVRCPNGLGQTFVHLRLGQCLLELGSKRKAADELMRAYMAGGREVFARQDGKYLAFLEEVLRQRGSHL